MSKEYYEKLRGKHKEVDLSWSDFSRDIQTSLFLRLSTEPVLDHCLGVYGLPRGGLPMAVCASNHFSLPLLLAPVPGCLIFDDLLDEGLSFQGLRRYLEHPDKPAMLCVWYINKTSKHCKHKRVRWMRAKTRKQWLQFPWE